MSAPKASDAANESAPYLDIPPERRAAHKAQAALLAQTAAKVALTVPLGADVDDFRRVLVANAPAVDKAGRS
jgi:hypothetical protein